MTNTSGITPVEYNVLVAPIEVAEKTSGGLFLPEDTRAREQFGETSGTLVAVSPGAFTFNYDGWPDNAKRPAVGAKVLFSRYQAMEVAGSDGRKYWLMKDTAIAAVKE